MVAKNSLDNLIPKTTLSTEEAREMQLKSAAKRKENNFYKKELEKQGKLRVDKIAKALIDEAEGGNIAAQRLFAEVIGKEDGDIASQVDTVVEVIVRKVGDES